ncbi:MAG TPA: FmdE family protein [Candidatus Manganitrophaceae bacterium]|nr:FmdE family protein [Candidatus Manganitrophaceae bacterium]
MDAEFKGVVDFHRHLCLDIAIGYRAAKALMREMGDQMKNMKEVVALVGNETCALDAIQEVTGCTFGKRNLALTRIGKPVYILQNTKTGKAVRAYCAYWDTFDHHELRRLRKEAAAPNAAPAQKAAFQKLTDDKIAEILSAPESRLFSIQHITLPPPPKTGKYEAVQCGRCGEHTDVALLTEKDGKKICTECLNK